MTTPPDAKKDPATFKLGDNPNEYADDDAKPSLAERIEAIAAMVHDGARFKPELRAIAAELREFEKGLPFYRAAENHCDLWERDYRNANDPAAITKRLWDAREAMFLAYRAMKEGK